MDVRHRINFFDTEIQVIKEEEDLFHVGIVSKATALGSGNVLEEYSSEPVAIEAAERLCRIYSVAKESGYHLLGNFFTKHDKEQVNAIDLMNADFSNEQIASHFQV
jgi:hypothetical protein